MRGIEVVIPRTVNGRGLRFCHFGRDGGGRVGAAAEALLVKIELLVVSARRRTAPRADGSPVTALEDGAVSVVLHRARPFVDVARRVVDTEGAAAGRSRARRLALPDVVDLFQCERAVAIGKEPFVEELPGSIDDARGLAARVARRVRQGLLALAGKGPFVLGAESLASFGTKGTRLVPGHGDDGIGALAIRVLVAIDAEMQRLDGQLGHERPPPVAIEGSAPLGESMVDPVGAGGVLQEFDIS